MDGQNWTDTNAFASPVTNHGGITYTYEFQIADGVYLIATAEENSVSAPVNYSSFKMGVANPAINDGISDETLIFNFSSDATGTSTYPLTNADFTLGSLASAEIATWEAYNHDLLVSFGTQDGASVGEATVSISSGVDSIEFANGTSTDWILNGTEISYSGTGTNTVYFDYKIEGVSVVGGGSITLDGGESVNLNQFDEVQFSSAAGSYYVTGMYATNPVDIPGIDHTINVDVLATDADGDTVADTFQVTFDDGDNVIEGTDNPESINYIADMEVDGGAGTDTLLVASGVVNLSNISNMEVIQLDTNATVIGSSSLGAITAADVITATGDSNSLIIQTSDGVGSDNTVNVDLTSLSYDGIVAGYHSYSNAGDTVFLQIEDSIDANVI